MNKPGTLNVVYFVHSNGHVTLAPYTAFPTLPDCIREVANTLPEVDRLQKRLENQEIEQMMKERCYEEAVFGARQEIIHDKLYSRMCSSFTTQWEKDVIREWLKLRDEKKREKYATIFQHTRLFFHAREFDSEPGRRSDEERVNLDRLEMKP